MRKINTKFFVFLVIALATTSGAIFGLHRLQAGNLAEALLYQSTQAEKDGKLDRAAKYLGRYLEFVRDDLDQRDHLGMILSDPLVATSPQRRARARFVIEQVLAKDPQRSAVRLRLTQILIASRDFDAAKEHLNYLEKNRPASAEIAYYLGEWHQSQNQTAPAQDAYRRAIKMDPSKADAYLRLVYLLKQADFGKEPQHAEEIDRLLAVVLEKAPQDAGVLSLAAQHAQEKGNTTIALNYLEDGLKQNPHEPRLYLALAHIYGQNNKRGEAIAKLQIGLQKVRKDQTYDLRWSLGNLLLDDNRLDDAKKAIQEMREINPLSAQYLDARSLMQRGRWFEAATLFEKIRPALKSVKALAFQLDLYLGACHEQLDEPLQQLTAFQRAAEMDPTSLKARRGMANARWALGQANEAILIYQDLVSRTKDADEAAQRRIEYVQLLLQSPAHRASHNWKLIDAELRAVEKTRSKSLDLHLLRAEFSFLQGDAGKAETMLQETIKEYPDRYEPWVALISFAASKKDVALTKQLMENAESRFQDKAEFRLAQVRFWSQHYSEENAAAMKRLEQGLAKFPSRDQSLMLQTMVEAHYFAGQYADCTRVLQRMTKLSHHVQDVRIRMQLLELALLQDDDAQAQALLREVKRLEGENSGSVDWSFGEALRLIRVTPKGNKADLEKARQLLTAAAAQRSNWHPILQARAELEERLGRHDQAIANYKKALDLGCRDPQVMKQLLVLLSQAHRYEEVEQVLARMHKEFGATDEVVRTYVVNTFQQGDLRKAEFLIKQIAQKKTASYRDHLWMGQIFSTTGRSPADAEKAFRSALALEPARPEIWFNLVRHLISVGQNDLAKTEIANAAKALAPESKELTLAQCYELLGQLQEAADQYKLALENHDRSVLTHRLAAEFYMRVNRFGLAEPRYRTMVEGKQVHPSEEEAATARRGLALALVKQNRPDKIAEALNLAGLTLDEKGLLPDGKIADAPEEQLLQAKVLGSLNHHRLRGKAILILEKLRQKNVLAAEDQFFLSRLQAQQGFDAASWSDAKKLIKALTEEHRKNSRYLAYAAMVHLQQKELTEAEQFIVRLEVVELERKTSPGGFGSMELRAKLFEMRGLGSKAIAILTTYAEDESVPARKLLLAGLQGRLGNFTAAIDLCESVRETATLYDDANATAVAILRHNKPSEAQPTKFSHWQRERQRVENTLRDALAKNPKNITVRLQLADLMELQSKYDEVEKLCREVLEQDATHLVAANNLAWQLGQQPKHAAEALALINRAIEKFGPRAELLDTRAIIQLNLGNTEQSLKDLERVVSEAPTPTRLFHLSRAYEKSRNASSALTHLRQANEMGLTMQQLHPAEQAEYQRVTAELNRRQ